MQLICLIPITQSGDELGYLPLLDFVVTDAGAREGMAMPSMLRSQLDLLQELLYVALASEGLRPVEDELGLRLTISEALAFAEEGAPIELRLVICPTENPSTSQVPSTSAQQSERSGMAAQSGKTKELVEIPSFDWDKVFNAGEF